MHMQVRHCFTAVAAVVDDQAISRGVQVQHARHVRGLEQEVSEQVLILWSGFVEAGQGLTRHDEHVSGRLGIHIAERHHPVVFINDLGRDLAVGNLLEDRAGSGHGGEGSADDERAGLGLGFLAQAAAEVIEDLVLKLIATGGPASDAGEALYTGAEAAAADDAWGASETIAHAGSES